MMRSLNKRERTLFWLCVGTLFLAANIYAINLVMKRIKAANGEVVNLENQVNADRALLYLESEAKERKEILDGSMPIIESAGKTAGTMLQYLRDEFRDRRLESDPKSHKLLENKKYSDYFDEVAVNVSFRGDAAEVMKLLITLQQPGQFYIVKNLEVELDKKSQKKEPQAICNLTLARWFKPSNS